MSSTEHEPPNAAPTGQETKRGEKREEERKERNETPAPHDTKSDDSVTEASEESFPASDAPPWTSSAT